MNDLVTVPVDLGALKQKQQAAWSSGDYAAIGTTLQIVGEQLCETIDLRAGTRVLDVAAGNGNATLAAARRFCDVTSTDYVPALLERSRERAAAERLEVTFQVEDAEKLSFADASFDVVLSTFGVMFVADHDRAAAEMARVCRPGGTVAMANWTPEGFIGEVFRTIGRHLPPPPGARSPGLWGTETAIRAMFGAHAAEIALHPRQFAFRYRSVDHFLAFFRTFYGPVHKAFAALGEGGAALEADLRAVLERRNVAGDGRLVVPSEYVEVVIRRR
jgi:SAM-dependent methyltransferase